MHFFLEYFNFTPQTLLPTCPSAHLNTIFNGKQHGKPSKQAENDLLIPRERVISFWQNKMASLP